MRKVLWLFMLCISIAASAVPASAGDHDILAGDILLALIPATGIAVAYLDDDVEGEKQWLRNIVANQTLTTILRVGFDQTSLGTRPDGRPYGFPSGHVAFAGAGASFLQERYGWRYGVPAWMAT